MIEHTERTSPPDLMTVRQTAEYLHVSEETVRRYLRKSLLTGVRPAGRKAGWRIEAAEVEEFLKPKRGRPWPEREERRV